MNNYKDIVKKFEETDVNYTGQTIHEKQQHIQDMIEKAKIIEDAKRQHFTLPQFHGEPGFIPPGATITSSSKWEDLGEVVEATEFAINKKIEPKTLSLEEYLGLFKYYQDKGAYTVTVLFDDRPEEVVIRIEFDRDLEMFGRLKEQVDSDLKDIRQGYRIESCKRIEWIISGKEVIE